MSIRVIYTNPRFAALLEYLGLPVPESTNPVSPAIAERIGNGRILFDFDGEHVFVSLDPADESGSSSFWADSVAVNAAFAVILPDGIGWLQDRVNAAVLVAQTEAFLAVAS